MTVEIFDAERNAGITQQDMLDDCEVWLEAYNGGWTNQQRLDAGTAESGADKELDFYREQFYEDQWSAWCDSVSS